MYEGKHRKESESVYTESDYVWAREQLARILERVRG